MQCGYIDLYDGTNIDFLTQHIKDKDDFDEVMEAIDWWIIGPYRNADSNIVIPYKYYFSQGIIEHERKHFRIIRDSMISFFNGAEGMRHFLNQKSTRLKLSNYRCPEDIRTVGYYISSLRTGIWGLLKNGINNSVVIDDNGNDVTEYICDREAKKTYKTIRASITSWALSENIISK
jgi:hypothetical protein